MKIDPNSVEFKSLPIAKKLFLIEERKKEIYREIESIFRRTYP